MPSLASCRLIVFAAVILVLGFPTLAPVRNAKVTVTDVERGTNFSATTNDAGEYVAGPLRVGRYTVTVEHSGFKKAVSEPVSLDVQQRIAVNVTLQVGQITEAIQVSGAAPLLETETSELGQVVDNKRVCAQLICRAAKTRRRGLELVARQAEQAIISPDVVVAADKRAR